MGRTLISLLVLFQLFALPSCAIRTNYQADPIGEGYCIASVKLPREKNSEVRDLIGKTLAANEYREKCNPAAKFEDLKFKKVGNRIYARE